MEQGRKPPAPVRRACEWSGCMEWRSVNGGTVDEVPARAIDGSCEELGAGSS